MSLQKQFAVKEKVRFQFRVDAFNVFNHAKLTGLNTTVNYSGTFPNGEAISNAPYNAAGQLVNQNGFGTVNATGIPHLADGNPNSVLKYRMIGWGVGFEPTAPARGQTLYVHPHWVPISSV